MCVHWDLAKGSAPSTPARRFGAPRRFRPRGRCGRRRVARGPDMTVRRFATTRPPGSDATPPSSSSTASATTIRRTDTTARRRWSATSRCTAGSGGQARGTARGSKGDAAPPRQMRNVAHCVGWLLTTNCQFVVRPRNDFDLRELSYPELVCHTKTTTASSFGDRSSPFESCGCPNLRSRRSSGLMAARCAGRIRRPDGWL